MPKAIAGTRGTGDTALTMSCVATSEFQFSFVKVIVNENHLVSLIFGVWVGTQGRKLVIAMELRSFESKPAMLRVPPAAAPYVGRVSSYPGGLKEPKNLTQTRC